MADEIGFDATQEVGKAAEPKDLGKSQKDGVDVGDQQQKLVDRVDQQNDDPHEILADIAATDASQNPLTQIVLNDLEPRAGDNGTKEKIAVGTILAKLRMQVEMGVSLIEDGIKVGSSVSEILPAELTTPTSINVVCDNEPIPHGGTNPFDDNWSPDYKDDVLGKYFDGDAYDDVLKFQKKLYGDDADVRLVRYGDTLVTVVQHKVGDGLRVIQVLDCDYPYTSTYQQFRKRVREENIDPTSWDRSKDQKKKLIPMSHLLVEDLKSGKVFDLKSLLPDDWELVYVPTESLAFSQDSTSKVLNCSEISTPEHLVGALHEYGHCVANANNPELFREINDLWQQSRMYTGGPQSIPMEIYNRTKDLLVANERGASSRAFQVIRILKEKGVDLGLPVGKMIDFVNAGLASYEKAYPGGSVDFLKKSKSI